MYSFKSSQDRMRAGPLSTRSKCASRTESARKGGNTVQRMRVLRLAGIGMIACGALLFLQLQPGFAQQASPTANTTATAKKLPPVHLDGQYFTRDGKRFLPVGAHWVPAKAAMQWPVQWDPKDIEADFAKMHELGYSIVRFDMMWAWFEPRPGDYNPVAFQQLDYFVERTGFPQRQRCSGRYNGIRRTLKPISRRCMNSATASCGST